MFGFDLKAVARAIVNGIAHQLARVRQGCATALMTLSEVLRPASAGRLPVAGSGTVTIPSRRSARDDAFEFPRFLAAFELMSGDQMTGLSQAAAFAPMRSPPEGPRIDVRGLLAVLFEQVEAMGASVSSKAGSCDPRVMIAVVIAATLFVRLAEANPRVSQRPAPRNTAADAIAERFAAASTDERDLSSLAERLDFAPRFRLVVREPHIENLDATPASGLVPGGGKSLPFDAQGVVIIRGLPAGARLSAGRHVMASPVSASVPRLAMLGATDWVVAQGDIDNLEVVLPPGVWPSVSATIEMIDADAISRGIMAIDVK
ncbi:MAG: hypothetical protein ABL907_02235, partial [Hyphomicrobium sp.]